MRCLRIFSGRITAFPVFVLLFLWPSIGQSVALFPVEPSMRFITQSAGFGIKGNIFVIVQAKKKRALNFDGIFDNNPLLKDQKSNGRTIDGIDCTTVIVRGEQKIILGMRENSGKQVSGDGYVVRPEVTRTDCY